MTNTKLPEMFQNELASQGWFKLFVPLALSGLALYLASSAILSAGRFLDKPIPTGSSTDVLAYASGAIFIAAMFMGAAFAVYLNVRFVHYLRSQQNAKKMAKDVLDRLSAKGYPIGVQQGQRIKIAH